MQQERLDVTKATIKFCWGCKYRIYAISLANFGFEGHSVFAAGLIILRADPWQETLEKIVLTMVKNWLTFYFIV